MSITIPSGVFAVYADAANAMLATTGFGVVCKLVYLNKIETMDDSTPSFRQKKVMDLQRSNTSGGFGRGDSNFRTVEQTEDITLRVYWSKKDFKKYGNIELPDGAVMTIGNYSDLTAINRASFLLINTSQTNNQDWKFEKVAEPTIHGLDGNYLMCYWNRV